MVWVARKVSKPDPDLKGLFSSSGSGSISVPLSHLSDADKGGVRDAPSCVRLVIGCQSDHHVHLVDRKEQLRTGSNWRLNESVLLANLMIFESFEDFEFRKGQSGKPLCSPHP